MIRALRRCLADYLERVASLKADRRRREEAIDYVIAHPDQFIGKDFDRIVKLCGPVYQTTSFDFGEWVAEWNGQRPTRLRVFVRDDICVAIEE